MHNSLVKAIRNGLTSWNWKPFRRFILQWHLTERCNLHCSHCYQGDSSRTEATFDRCLEIVSCFGRFLEYLNTKNDGPRWRGRITLTGGEPFLRGDFIDLLSRLASYGPSLDFAILTNGSLIDERVAGVLADLKPVFVQVSIDGDRRTHDGQRATGDFDRTLSAARRLGSAGVRTLVSFTAHQGNYKDFPSVVKSARKAHVHRIWADRYIPLGNAAGRLLPLNPEQTEAFFRTMAGTIRPWPWARTETAMHRGLQFLVAGGWPYRCTAGERLLAVMPDGEVYPCRRLPIPVGNVFTDDFVDIYERNRLVNELRNPSNIPEACGPCAHAESCRGGLRCLANAVTGDPFQPDPGCWLPRR